MQPHLQLLPFLLLVLRLLLLATAAAGTSAATEAGAGPVAVYESWR